MSTATDAAIAGAVPVLRVTVSGGGPVGLSFALLLAHFMGERVAITVHDSRWNREGAQIVWKNEAQGNTRRQQVVTIQSRQYLNLPEEVQARVFSADAYSEVWPTGPDSMHGYRPRNVHIAHMEDQLLALANEQADRIRLIPTQFNPVEAATDLVNAHVLAICEGSHSHTRDYFTDQFGNADTAIYSLHGLHVQDVVLGLHVKSELPDPMAVLLTVAQNRFLLNTLRGEGFLNMRLTASEAQEVVGTDPRRHVLEDCLQSHPCTMERTARGEFRCTTHRTVFAPAAIKGSGLWKQIQEGLTLFRIPEAQVRAVTVFRMDMVQRPRFTAQIYHPTARTPGTYGFLLGDTANAIHFWPGRGLNSGLTSGISLARCLAGAWRGDALRDADFLRHEAVMAMLQYRHKSRAWRSMVTTDADGARYAIKEKIAQGMREAERGSMDTAADSEALIARLRQIREHLAPRLPGMPDDRVLRDHVGKLTGETVHTLLMSGAWDTVTEGGEEVDVDRLFNNPDSAA